MTDIDLKALPPSVRPFVAHLGIVKAIEILKEFGGQTAYIPGRPTLKHAAVNKFGLDVVVELAKIWPDCNIQVPMPDKAIKRIRDKALLADDKSGMGTMELVSKYGVTRQQIGNIRREREGVKKDMQTARGDDSQLSFTWTL